MLGQLALLSPASGELCGLYNVSTRVHAIFGNMDNPKPATPSPSPTVAIPKSPIVGVSAAAAAVSAISNFYFSEMTVRDEARSAEMASLLPKRHVRVVKLQKS